MVEKHNKRDDSCKQVLVYLDGRTLRFRSIYEVCQVYHMSTSQIERAIRNERVFADGMTMEWA